jgi:hypothetical protein
MKNRKIWAILAAIVVLAGPAYAQAPAAQQDNARDKGQRSRGEATADPNIKTARPTNRADAPRPAPEKKGGQAPATRGVSVCAVVFDNYTGWPVDTYTDGDYTGTVAAWGDLTAYAIAGGTRLYARVTFVDGSSATWGPRTISCPANGVFTWYLDPPA